jgi:hypothetical protein
VNDIIFNLKRARKTTPRYFDYYVELAVPSFAGAKNSSPVTTTGRVERIKEARVVGIDDATLRLFGRAMNAKTFGELIEVAVQTDADLRWLSDLYGTLELASKGYTNLQANMATFAIGAKRFRPFLHRVDTFEGTDEIERYHLSIIEDTSAPSALRIIDKDYAMVAELLKLSFRMKFEVLEPASAAEPSATAIKDVIDALNRVETDARLVGLEEARFEQLLDSLLVQKVLQSQEAAEIEDSVKRWSEIHATKGQSPKALDIAIANHEYEEALKILRSFADDNDRFLKVMVRVFERMTIGEIE